MSMVYSYSEYSSIELLLEAADVFERSMPGVNSREFRKYVDQYMHGEGDFAAIFGLTKSSLSRFHLSKRDEFLVKARSHLFLNDDEENNDSETKQYLISRAIKNEVNDFRQQLENCDLDDFDIDSMSELSKCIFNAFNYSKKYGVNDPPKTTAPIHKMYLKHYHNVLESKINNLKFI